MAENPILKDEEQDKGNSPPHHPTTPVYERPTQPAVLMRSRPFGRIIADVPNYAYRNLFE